MRWLRFSIASLTGFIAYLAVGLTALSQVGDYNYGRIWDDAYYMITVFALAIATIMAVLTRGRSRARWLGFAVFGWVHLMFGWPDAHGSPQSGGTYRPRFPHTTLINWAFSPYILDGWVHPWAVVQTGFTAVTNPVQGNFTWHIIQTTITMSTALTGALVGNYLAIRVERQEAVARDATPR